MTDNLPASVREWRWRRKQVYMGQNQADLDLGDDAVRDLIAEVEIQRDRAERYWWRVGYASGVAGVLFAALAMDEAYIAEIEQEAER